MTFTCGSYVKVTFPSTFSKEYFDFLVVSHVSMATGDLLSRHSLPFSGSESTETTAAEKGQRFANCKL